MRNALVFISDSSDVPASPTLRTDFADGEPRIKDTDLAVLLGYSDTRHIKPIVRRYAKDLAIYHTVSRIPGQAGRPGKTFHLTESQAVFITMKADTARAIELSKVVAEVFVAARRGELPMACAAKAIAAATVDDIESLNGAMQVLGERFAKTVLPLLAEVAALRDKVASLEQAATFKPSTLPPSLRPAPVPAPTRPEVLAEWTSVFRWDTEIRKLGLSSKTRGVVGWRASQIMRERGLYSGKASGRSFGTVNTYPIEVIEAAWQHVQRKAA